MAWMSKRAGFGQVAGLSHSFSRPLLGGWRADAIHQLVAGDRLGDEHGGVAIHVCPDGSAEILQGGDVSLSLSK
jgi:hypothetical protein